MVTLVVNSETGYGKCTNKNGTELTVLRAGGLWNLSAKYSGFSFWVKENVKRVSTLQRFADDKGYGIKIEVI